MSIRLNGIPLYVQDIHTDEGRAIVEHGIPGMQGSLLQDLGKKLTRISLTGTLYGEKVKEDLEKLREGFKAGEPLSFEADIITSIDISEVLIETMEVNEVAGEPNHFRYKIVLREHLVAPEEKSQQAAAEALQQLEALAGIEAENFLKDLLGGLDIQDQLKSKIDDLKRIEAQLSSEEFLSKCLGFSNS